MGERKRTEQRFWLILASVLVLHLVCWQASKPLRAQLAQGAYTASLHKRSLGTLDAVLRHNSSDPHNPPPESTPGSAALLDYWGLYQHASPAHKPLVFGAMILWLTFLFAFVGITASDFFCPNLSTIADRLGLSESVAGVTFLAWSNGSPDVFSTFSALRAHSGSLAIGELLGAASFITMVVAGTMCLIQPFRVSPHTFLRDVGFFTVAVSFTLRILWDNHIHAWEAASMVTLYVVYVIFVAIGSWWNARRERTRELIRQARNEYAEESNEYHDEPPTPGGLRRTPKSRGSSGATTPNAFPFPGSPLHPHSHGTLDDDTFFTLSERGTPVTLTRRRSGSTANQSGNSPLVRRPKSRSAVRPSLLGAIEFRDVVNSLRADSSARTLAVFGGQGDDRHTHASLIGSESNNASRSAHRQRHQRSSSHSGALEHGASTPVSPEETGPHHPKSLHESAGRRTSNAFGGPHASGPWDEDDEDDDGDDEESERMTGSAGALIDLSEGVDDPWRGASREALSISIPPFAGGSSGPPSRTLSDRGVFAAERGTLRRVPSILLTTDAGEEEMVLASPALPSPSRYAVRHRRGYHIARAVFLALFPSLQDFGEKSWVGKGSAILCVPAILVLNLTLPVVDSEQDDCDSIEEKECDEEEYRDFGDALGIHQSEPRRPVIDDGRQARANRNAVSQEFHSHVLPHREITQSPWDSPAVDLFGVDQRLTEEAMGNHESTLEGSRMIKPDLASPPPTPADQSVNADELTRWLTVVQCTLAPPFCVTALFGEDLVWWYPLAALAGGLGLASIAYVKFKDHRHPGRIVLCFVGFFVAMVWILMIVNEVVGVLQAVGLIFGLSDAILGLTIFAMGNSLGDLVANATVARMGFPSMAIAACFGGPMLNILLGVGLSGSYIIYQNEGKPYHVDMGKTLVVSGVSLLIVLVATLILVPLNGYWMNRRLGAGLIAAYGVVLATNIAVEIWA